MWILFSVLAAFCWALSSIIDKYVLTKWVKNPLVPIILTGIIGLVACIIVYFVYGFSSLSYFNTFLAIIAGFFYILATIFYFKALKIEEVSRIVPLFYLSPLFILIFAGIFLGEVFVISQYLGIILLMVGAILISSKGLSRISLGKAFWWMMLSVIAISLNALLTKYLLNFADYWTIFAWTKVGAAIGVIPVVYIYLPELMDTIKRYGKKVVAAMSTSEALTVSGFLFSTIALSVGYVTLVGALSSVEPLFVLLFAAILSIFYPSVLKEEIGKSVIFQKILAIILMFIGAILIT